MDVFKFIERRHFLRNHFFNKIKIIFKLSNFFMFSWCRGSADIMEILESAIRFKVCPLKALN